MAAPALVRMVRGLRNTIGFPVELAVAWSWVTGAVAGCLLLGLAASVVPARTALRRPG
ncbi:hypothetical protein [Streptomyces albipurpureus]|uniref:ABC transporter permease n=1 Tax=Streptomyces albipurpureus TaxID=2897419 RepID=A0ABT0ULI4_9ACTN|nr:hypothetical protein [Streptomyces sp. CWNU-1]MCM2389479.1 hypothetical protein [Streptomyces sp. CWNU-1]